MSNNSYIDHLAKDWEPSSKKQTPWIYIALFSLTIVFLFLEFNLKSSLLHPMRLDFIIPYFIVILGLYSMFQLSSPGSNLTGVLIISLSLLFLRTVYMVWNINWIEFSSPAFYTIQHSFCPSHFIAYALPLLFVFFYLFRSRFTTQIRNASIIGIISSFCLAEIVLNAFCPDTRFSHLSFWHMLSWGIPITVGIIFYKRNLEW